MPIILKSFYMIRHGETEANAARLMAGSLDSPLTDKGRAQADVARLKIESLPEKPAFIVHSQLSRARETAEIINQNLGLPMIEDPDYAEMHAGDWEGIPYDQCNAMMRDWQDPPGGETFDQFTRRIARAKNKALSLPEFPPLIVCHGGVFRAFAKLYELNTWGVENCHLHHFAPVAGTPFPWEVHSFSYDGILQKNRSESFHAETD